MNTTRVVKIGNGKVAHYIVSGMSACKRDVSNAETATVGMSVCKTCAAYADAELRRDAVERETRTVAEIVDYATARAADNKRITARLNADVAIERAATEKVHVGSALSDKRITALAPVQIGNHNANIRIPFSFAWNAINGDVWNVVATQTMTSAFSARLIARMRLDLPTFVFQLLMPELDDVSTHIRLRAVDSLTALMSSDDVTRHGADHVCDTCNRTGNGGSESSPFGTRTVEYAPTAMADGTVAFSYDRPSRCGECIGCESTSDNKWLTRHCEAPVMTIDHVSIGGVIGRALRSGLRSYSDKSKRNDRPTGFGTHDYVIAVAESPSVSLIPSLDHLSNVPSVIADLVSKVAAGLAIAGASAVGANGKISEDAATMLAIVTGNVTRTDAGIVASPNQRRTAVDKFRDMWADASIVDVDSDDAECLCRWNNTGQKIRRCDGHGGMRALRNQMSDVAGTRYITNNGGGVNTVLNERSTVAGLEMSAEERASIVYTMD